MTNRKSHTPFRLVPKSTTLDDNWTADVHSIAERMRVSEPTTKILMKIDPYYQQQYMVLLIFAGVPWRVGIKRQWGCRQRQFSAFSLTISSETLEISPALLYSDTHSVVGFSVIPKCVTLNDLEWLFCVKFCFHVGLAGYRPSKIIAWELIEIDTYCQRRKSSAVSGSIKFVRIFAQVL